MGGWGGGRVRVCVHVCVCVYIVFVKYFPCIWAVFSSVFHWVVDALLLIILNVFLCKWRARKQISLHRDNKVVLYWTELYCMMFSLAPNKMDQRKEPIGFYLFIRMETILSNFVRNWQSFTASLVLQIVMWRYRDAKEPLIPEQGKTNYFLMITPALTKPGHCVPSTQAKCPCIHPHSLQSRFKLFFLSFFLPGDEAETGREEVFNGYMVWQHLSFQSSWIFPSS